MQAYSEKEGLLYFETSALEATNVEQAFQCLLQQVHHIVSSKYPGSKKAAQVRGVESCRACVCPLALRGVTKIRKDTADGTLAGEAGTAGDDKHRWSALASCTDNC